MFYDTDLRRAVHDDEEWGCRRLYNLIFNLPYDAAFFRAQGRRDPQALFHEWALTLLQFQAGEKVTPPAFLEEHTSVEAASSNGDGGAVRLDVNDPDSIAAFYEEHLSG